MPLPAPEMPVDVRRRLAGHLLPVSVSSEALRAPAWNTVGARRSGPADGTPLPPHGETPCPVPTPGPRQSLRAGNEAARAQSAQEMPSVVPPPLHRAGRLPVPPAAAPTVPQGPLRQGPLGRFSDSEMRLGELPFPRSQLGGGEAGTGSPAALTADTGAETAQASPLRAARRTAQVSGLPPSRQEPGSTLPAPRGTHSRNQSPVLGAGSQRAVSRPAKLVPGQTTEVPGPLGNPARQILAAWAGPTRWDQVVLPASPCGQEQGVPATGSLSPALPLVAE